MGTRLTIHITANESVGRNLDKHRGGRLQYEVRTSLVDIEAAIHPLRVRRMQEIGTFINDYKRLKARNRIT